MGIRELSEREWRWQGGHPFGTGRLGRTICRWQPSTGRRSVASSPASRPSSAPAAPAAGGCSSLRSGTRVARTAAPSLPTSPCSGKVRRAVPRRAGADAILVEASVCLFHALASHEMARLSACEALALLIRTLVLLMNARSLARWRFACA
jgi:hypothetical protein